MSNDPEVSVRVARVHEGIQPHFGLTVVTCNGAIVVNDALLAGRGPQATIAEILETLRTLAGGPAVTFDAEVTRSEAETGYRNASLANFMRAFGSITNPVDGVLETYFRQCAWRMNCVQLARAGAR